MILTDFLTNENSILRVTVWSGMSQKCFKTCVIGEAGSNVVRAGFKLSI